jgi:ABC-type transport system involved in multi-copper enzyme maturation permease subunit
MGVSGRGGGEVFLTILAKETRVHLMTFRFAAAVVTIFALVIVSVWVLADDYRRRNDAYLSAAELSARHDSQEVYVPSQISPTVHRPPSRLSIFVEGEERRLGNSVRISRWSVPTEASGSFTDNIFMAALQPFDLQTIFSIVVSLFALLLTYDAISGEREGGTLKMICTGGLKRGTLFAAKFSASLICIAIPLLLTFACCLVMLSFVFNLQFSASQWLAIALIVLAGLIYAALFIALGLLSSVLVRRSSTALVLALLIWALGVLVIPAAAQKASGLAVYPPQPAELTKLERELSEETRAKSMVFDESHPYWGSGWTGGYGQDGGYWMFDGGVENYRQTADYVRFIEPLMLSNADRLWQVFQSQERSHDRQVAVADALSAVAPAHQLRSAFTLLAGTDMSAYEKFMRSARRYREQLIDGFRSKGYFGRDALRFFTRRDEATIGDDLYAQRQQEYRRLAESDYEAFRTQIGPQAWGPLPKSETQPFMAVEEEPDFKAAMSPMMVLALGVMLVFTAGFAAFIRYDVR